MMMFKEPAINSSVKHLKVDIDGLDLLVLAGAVNTLAMLKPYILNIFLSLYRSFLFDS